MILPRRYFPWRIFRSFVFRTALFTALLLVGAGFSVRYFVFQTLLSQTDVAIALGEIDEYLTGLGITLFCITMAFAAWSARYYFRPLGRMIQKARELRRGEAVAAGAEAGGALQVIDEDAGAEEPGEWAQLERSLLRIHRDLRQKTEQSEREREELAALLGGVAEAILAIDREETALFFNPQLAMSFGVQGRGRFRTLKLGEVFRSPDVLAAFRGVLQTGAPRTAFVTLHAYGHNVSRHFQLACAPLRNEQGQLYGAVGIFHDITELKQAEQIRIEFVANASHELRTPLTSVKGYLETVREDLKAGRMEAIGGFLDIISRNVDRLSLLVNDLLDLSSIESGAELKKSQIGTREVTEAMLKQLETKRASKRIEIRTEFSQDRVFADGRRVEQVLLNLVHNAIKYVPEGRRIEIRWRAGPSGATVLSVKDNGPGISTEHQPRLFERFYRVDAGRSREQGGTGLGLSIVKHIMIKHGGKVELVSRLGEGAEFVCTFPPAPGRGES